MPAVQSSSKSSSATSKPATAAKQQQPKQKAAAPAATSAEVDKLAKDAETLKIKEAATSVVGAGPTTSGSGSKTPPEQPEFIKQALTLIEKKMRNLEKRKSKLEEYRDIKKTGKELNADQALALTSYDEVIRTLESTREMEKAFMQFANDAMKQQKKQAKRDQMEREESESKSVCAKLKEAQKYLAILEAFDNSTVRNDFLKDKKGDARVYQNDIDLLEDFAKLVHPALKDNGAKFDSELAESVEHLLAVIDAKAKPVPTVKATKPATYADLNKLFEKLHKSPYWTKKEEKVEKVEAPVETVKPASPETAAAPQTHRKSSPGKQQQQHQNQQHQNEQTVSPPRQTYANQESTSESDYVIVPTTEAHEQAYPYEQQQQQYQQHSQQQHQQEQHNTAPNTNQNDFHHQQQQQQHPHKYTFTTLNQAELPANQNSNEVINKFENNDAGLNFFQDSEVSHTQQPQSGQGNDGNYNNQEQDVQRDGQFRTRGGRGGNNNGNNNYHPKPRYNDDRRNNGPSDNRQPRGNMQGGAPQRQQHNGPSDGSHYNNNGGARDGQFNGGGRGNFRGGPASNGPRGGGNYNSGGYRGGANHTGEGGARRPQNNNYQQAPRNYQETSQQHPQPV